MIKIKLTEYFANKDEYLKQYDKKHIFVVGDSIQDCHTKYNILQLPSIPYTKDGVMYVIPKYITSEEGIENYIKDHDPIPENLYVEIDDEADRIWKRNKEELSSKVNYLNLDDFPYNPSKTHWFNILVLDLYKELFNNSCFVSDKEKAKKYFKILTNEDNIPMNYAMLYKLFELTYVNDSDFERFVKSKK